MLFPKAILDPFAKTWGDIGQNSGTVSLTVNGTSFTLDDVRKKFAADATIWLYLCHGASDPRLFQEVANTFQVTAKGFTKEIVYCAPDRFPDQPEAQGRRPHHSQSDQFLRQWRRRLQETGHQHERSHRAASKTLAPRLGNITYCNSLPNSEM